MRYPLRTLLILLALGPPLLAGGYWWWAKTVSHQTIQGGVGGYYVTEYRNDGSSATRKLPELNLRPAPPFAKGRVIVRPPVIPPTDIVSPAVD